MKFVLHKVTVVISACVLVMSTHMPAARAQSPVAQVEQGALAGVTVDGISSFKGIPFAAPPVGELRWQAPQPADVWAGTRNANAYGNACIQPVVQSLEGSEPVGAQSEDCLYLNVWTAGADPNAKRPVMVWIHGGAYNVGAGGLKMYDGTALAKRGAVLVNFNYRVGSLGFFAHPALEQASPNGPINFGLLDQIAALQWVKKNIATFGGDPNNVTIFGESAGGQSVLALYASPLAKGLFQRGIAQSPYGIPEAPRTKALEVGANVANAIGLNGANATLSELRAVPAEKFAQSRGGNLSLAPVPAYGDSVLPRTTLDTFSNGQQARLPLIIGTNSDEASVAVAFGIDPAVLIEKVAALRIAGRVLYPGVTDNSELGRLIVRDVAFTAPAKRMAQLHARVAPAYRYFFSYVAETLREQYAGVSHGGEIVYVFTTPESLPAITFTQADLDMMQRVSSYWLAFASTGKPAVEDSPVWPVQTTRNDQLLELGEKIEARNRFMQPRLNLIIPIYPRVLAGPAK